MDFELLQKLKNWRSVIAKKEGVELYRVLPNKTIEMIAELKPKTKKDLLFIKGIKEKKFGKYGIEILSLVNNGKEITENVSAEDDDNIKAYTVSGYLDILNFQLKQIPARIKGEVSSLDIRNNYLFFSIKDIEDESVLTCFMWKRSYDLCGINIEEGMEIIVEGFPEIHKTNGKFSFKTITVELVGEGVLKKAYDALKNKLEKEGLFLPEKKKKIPDFPKRIGLITSETGAVIHDFLNNLGKHGYYIQFIDSRVEGQIAVRSLMSAIGYFENKDIDALVIIRGGGSLESLQAFNNEALVRKIAEFKIPVICGIGHDKDVPLASMAADKAVSTPTAITKILDEAWDKALSAVSLFEREILNSCEKMLSDTKFSIDESVRRLTSRFNIIFKKFEDLRYGLINATINIGYRLKNIKRMLADFSESLLDNFKRWFEQNDNFLNNTEKQFKIFNPVRYLKLGYSIVSSDGGIIKSIKQVVVGNDIDIRVADGKITSKIKNITND